MRELRVVKKGTLKQQKHAETTFAQVGRLYIETWSQFINKKAFHKLGSQT